MNQLYKSDVNKIPILKTKKMTKFQRPKNKNKQKNTQPKNGVNLFF